MLKSLHPAPSVGGVVKKILEVRQDLEMRDIMEIINRSMESRGALAGDFASAKVLNEAKALELAKSWKREY
jgi:hypothetical protein